MTPFMMTLGLMVRSKTTMIKKQPIQSIEGIINSKKSSVKFRTFIFLIYFYKLLIFKNLKI